MKLGLKNFRKPSFDPDSAFEPEAIAGDETIANAMLDPAIFAAQLNLPTNELRRTTSRLFLRDVLRQQQFLVFDVGRSVGVLQAEVPKVVNALQLLDLGTPDVTASSLAAAMAQTAIGLAAKALSAVPNLYVQIAAAALQLTNTLVRWAQWLGKIDQPQARLVIPEIPVQEYDSRTDADLFNQDVRWTLQSSLDWTRIFAPRYAGKLTGVTYKNDLGQRSIGWALGTGEIPRVIFPASKRRADRNNWRYEDARTEGGGYLPSGGLGMIPGGDRIYGILQTTATERPLGPARGHPTVYDRRCDAAVSSDPVVRTDLGSYYPTTTQGATSLWSWVKRPGPEMFTVDAIGLTLPVGRPKDSTGAELVSWPRYLQRIWEGVVQLWRNETYEGGWGCSFWKAALQQLVGNYTVGTSLGVLSWAPTSNKALTPKDQDAWEKHNVYDVQIKARLQKLTAEQLLTLGKTNIAAYLPVKGGVEADPQKQKKVLGAFRDHVLARQFAEARRRILETDAKHSVCLPDVLDDKFKRQIKDAGGGTRHCDPIPTRTTPDGGGGGAAIAAAAAAAAGAFLLL